MQIEYSNVVFPPSTVIHGKTTRAMSNREGRKLVRIVESGRDDLVVSQPGRPDYHIAWSRTGGGVVVGAKPLAKSKRRSEGTTE